MIVVPLTAATACATAIVPCRERVDLEHAHRAVPDDGLGAGDDRRDSVAIVFGPMSSPMRSPIARIADVERLGRRAGFELRRHDVIDRQLEPHAALLRAAFDVARRVEQVVLDERLADRRRRAP